LKEWNRQGQLSIPDISRATEQFFSLLKGEVHIKAIMQLAPKPSEPEMQEHLQAAIRLFLAGYLSKTATGQP